MRARWLERSLMTGPHLTLCTSEAEYLVACRHLKVTPGELWLTDGFPAKTHALENEGGNRACIVCIDVGDGHELAAIAALLVHEAVHVFQQHRESIGDHTPSAEGEAYGIQHIAYQLVSEYMRRTA